jgi:hypothetical protein
MSGPNPVLVLINSTANYSDLDPETSYSSPPSVTKASASKSKRLTETVRVSQEPSEALVNWTKLKSIGNQLRGIRQYWLVARPGTTREVELPD